MRWPTASASPSGESSVARSSSGSTCARGACSSRESIVLSWPSSSVSLRLLEPALTTSTRKLWLSRRAGRWTGARPAPVADIGRVLTVFAGVGAVAQSLVLHLLAHVAGALGQAGNAV